MTDNFEIVLFGSGSSKVLGDTIYIHYEYQGKVYSYVYVCGSKFGLEQLISWHQKHKRQHIDALIISHADKDHAQYGAELVRQMKVNSIWMHQPWKYINDIYPKVNDGRITPQSLENRLIEKYSIIYEIAKVANQKSVPICEPKQGTNIGQFTIISPSKNLYMTLLQESGKTPEMSDYAKSSKEYDLIEEFVDNELLDDQTSTDPENEMSLVLSASLAGRKILLTGDIGGRGFNDAFNYACNCNINIDNYNVIQLPHHGSRHNITPAIMDKLFGAKYTKEKSTIALLTAPSESVDHPHGSVVNAAIRRNANVFIPASQGFLVYGVGRIYDDLEDVKPEGFRRMVKR